MFSDTFCLNSVKNELSRTSTARKKRKAAGSDGSESADPPVYSHWLMKSEPESRFENGVDVKVGSGFFS